MSVYSGRHRGRKQKASERSVGDACLSMAHGIKSHQLNKMEKYLHRAQPNRKEKGTHRQSMAWAWAAEECCLNSAQNVVSNHHHQWAAATRHKAVSRLLGSFFRDEHFQSVLLPKEIRLLWISIYQKTLILTVPPCCDPFFFRLLTLYLNIAHGNFLMMLWVRFTIGACGDCPAFKIPMISQIKLQAYVRKYVKDNVCSLRASFHTFLCLCNSLTRLQWTLDRCDIPQAVHQ